ncbi:MAG: GTPase, partial [Prochlorococcus sp.]|nr:50S ribosome-binding GTPase [Prochlorococcaceae cyanobacterium ETNP1_MAG_8]
MNHTPSTPERCRLLLAQWHKQLSLSQRENNQLAGELIALNRQLKRLEQRRLRVAVFGRVGVGKSSLLNALLGQDVFATDVAHGSTRNQQAVDWCQPINNLESIELVDTPGIDEIADAGRARLA